MRKLSLILIGLFICSNALATDFYVKTGGNDGLDGLSDGNAWATIAKVNAQTFSAGDNIYFNQGDTWTEILVVPSSGTSGNQITFGSYGVGARPIFTIANATNDHVIKTNAKDYITFTGLEINGNKANQTTKGDGINSGGWSSHNIICDDLYIYDTFHSGIYVNGTDTITITDSTFEDNGQAGVDTTVYGMGIHCASSKNATISGNTILGSLSDGISMASNALYAGEDFIINGNDISDVLTDQRSLIQVWSATNGSIYNNTLHDTIDETHGINAIFTRGHSGADCDVDIYDNTITSVSGVGVELQDGGATVYNNTIALTGTGSDAMGIFIAGNNHIIRDNIVGPTTRHGIYLAGATSNISIYRNKVFNAQNNSSLIRQVNNTGTSSSVLIYNNILYDDQGSVTTARGIYITGTETSSGLNVLNNTLHNLPLGIEIAVSDNATIQNNIISLAGTNTYALHLWSTNTNVDSDYNCFFPEEADFLRFAPTSYSTLAAFTAATGLDTNSTVSDPLLGSNYTLNTGSPAIGTGVVVNIVYNDYRQGGRTSLYDIGAFTFDDVLKNCTINNTTIN